MTWLFTFLKCVQNYYSSVHSLLVTPLHFVLGNKNTGFAIRAKLEEKNLVWRITPKLWESQLFFVESCFSERYRHRWHTKNLFPHHIFFVLFPIYTFPSSSLSSVFMRLLSFDLSCLFLYFWLQIFSYITLALNASFIPFLSRLLFSHRFPNILLCFSFTVLFSFTFIAFTVPIFFYSRVYSHFSSSFLFHLFSFIFIISSKTFSSHFSHLAPTTMPSFLSSHVVLYAFHFSFSKRFINLKRPQTSSTVFL
jgi:hypothetical protein